MAEQEPKRSSPPPPIEDEGYPDEPIPLSDADGPAPTAPPAPEEPFAREETEVIAPKAVPAASGESPQAMEERMRRIEDALAALVARQTEAEKPAGKGAFAEASELLEETRKILPTAKKALRAKDRAEKAIRAAADATSDERWVLVEAFAELRDILSMYVDRRYEVTWACWLVPAGGLLTMVLFYFTLGQIPIFGTILDKLADVFVLFVVYKILRRESVLYREATDAAKTEEEEAKA
ncbi:MAG: hypothetical protein AB7K24_16310 [Gemmataceae bacterium]